MQFSYEANVMLKLYIGNETFLPFSAGEVKWKSKVLASGSRLVVVKLFSRNGEQRNGGECAEWIIKQIIQFSRVLCRLDPLNENVNNFDAP